MRGTRSLLASAWMGIQHDLSWTTPPLSLGIRAVAPFASAMTVSIIYWFGVTGGGLNMANFDPLKLAYVLVGSTLYAHVASYAWVPTIAIAEGKNLSVFPHIYLTARSTALYVAGRAMSAFVISTITSLVALGVAYYILVGFLDTSIPLIVTPLSVLMLAGALLANIPAALGLGYFLGAYSLYASKFEWSLPGYVAGLLMVFCGALFPPDILGHPISDGANYIPFTQFIAAARDALVYDNFGGYLYSMSICLAGGLLLLGASLWVYFASEKKARKDGVIDRRLA